MTILGIILSIRFSKIMLININQVPRVNIENVCGDHIT